MKKRNIAISLTVLTPMISMAPILASCGNAKTYSVMLHSGEIPATLSINKAVEGKKYEANITWDDPTYKMSDGGLHASIVGGGPIEISFEEVSKGNIKISIESDQITGDIAIILSLEKITFDVLLDGCPSGSSISKTFVGMYEKFDAILGWENQDIFPISTIEIKNGTTSLVESRDYSIDKTSGVLSIKANVISDTIHITFKLPAKRTELLQKDFVRFVEETDENGDRVVIFPIQAFYPVKIGDQVSVVITEQEESTEHTGADKAIKWDGFSVDTENNIYNLKFKSTISEDNSLFEVKFKIHFQVFRNSTTLDDWTTENYIYYENAIASTPDMYEYDENDSTVLVGPKYYFVSDMERWDKCDVVVIPKFVTKIGRAAFDKIEDSHASWLLLDETWGGLTDPEGCKLKEVGFCAFQACKSTRSSLYIPASIETIDQTAFGSMPDINAEIVFANNSKLTTIGAGAFIRSSFKGDLVIPKSVKKLYRTAFRYCSFSSISFEEGCQIEEIGYSESASNAGHTFGCNFNLSGTISIPSSVKTIHESSFSCFSKTETITQSNNVDKVIIPKSVKEIGDDAFRNLNNLSVIDMTQWTGIPEWTGTNIFTDCAPSGKILVSNKLPESDQPAFLSWMWDQGIPKAGAWTLEVVE